MTSLFRTRTYSCALAVAWAVMLAQATAARAHEDIEIGRTLSGQLAIAEFDTEVEITLLIYSAFNNLWSNLEQIGRASCRERV